MSVSRLVDDMEIGIIENIEDIGGLQRIPILGPNGMQQLNKDFNLFKNKDAPSITWPVIDEEWIEAQEKDPQLKWYMDKLKDGGSCFMDDLMICQY